MPSREEVRAVDKLVLELDRGNERLEREMTTEAQKMLSGPTTKKALRDLMISGIMANNGDMAPYLLAILNIQLGQERGTFVPFVEGDVQAVFAQVAALVNDIDKTGSLAPIGRVKDASSTLTMTTLDNTQDNITTAEGEDGDWVVVTWTRHLDGKACDWCRSQVDHYEQTKQWLRHYGCKCAKTRKV